MVLHWTSPYRAGTCGALHCIVRGIRHVSPQFAYMKVWIGGGAIYVSYDTRVAYGASQRVRVCVLRMVGCEGAAGSVQCRSRRTLYFLLTMRHKKYLNNALLFYACPIDDRVRTSVVHPITPFRPRTLYKEGICKIFRRQKIETSYSATAVFYPCAQPVLHAAGCR